MLSHFDLLAVPTSRLNMFTTKVDYILYKNLITSARVKW